jgi:hypothetical protein
MLLREQQHNPLPYTSISNMSTTSTTQILNPQKRKRTVVSYAQVDPLADLLIDDEDVTMDSCPESSDDESDDDDRTYSRRRVCF